MGRTSICHEFLRDALSDCHELSTLPLVSDTARSSAAAETASSLSPHKAVCCTSEIFSLLSQRSCCVWQAVALLVQRIHRTVACIHASATQSWPITLPPLVLHRPSASETVHGVSLLTAPCETIHHSCASPTQVHGRTPPLGNATTPTPRPTSFSSCCPRHEGMLNLTKRSTTCSRVVHQDVLPSVPCLPLLMDAANKPCRWLMVHFVCSKK